MADPIAENEIAALTRRYEDTCTDIETIKRDVLSLKVDVAEIRRDLNTLGTKFDAFVTEQRATNAKFDAFVTEQQAMNAEQRSINATLVDLLTNLVGRDAD
ncbi:hypothetical protein ACFOSC_15690 [Streptantibioticus rubrisoli]|uniref:Uncharacterized protein n=1 Tax=Streptantibioticus rubrisoli TaxID=1387313 RepID=A0ABT1PFF3_9ACTN|nr:hypothetical protein [Streptantibioticus rubrisoli]MCQ4044092.1 hypothetical protein [Streptantibioticus rubrisoli]